MAMDAEDEELAGEVAGLIADRLGDDMSLRGSADIGVIVTDSHAAGNVAELALDDGGTIVITTEVRRG